jgi:hypothetical protein
MAKRGRTLSNKIGLSATIADLGDLASVVLATWFPLYADDQGRLEANPRRLKAEVCPLLDLITPADIATALQRMVDVGYIICYQHNGTPLLQLVSWWRWNDAMPYTATSDYPAPPGWVDCPAGRETAKRGGYGFREIPRLSEKVSDFLAVAAEVVEHPILNLTTTATPLDSSLEGESEGEPTPPAAAMSEAELDVRMAAIMPVVEAAGMVLNSLTAQELVVTIEEHPRADEQATARVLAKLCPNLPKGDRITPALVGQVLGLVEDFPEAAILAQIASTASDRCRPKYLRAALTGQENDRRNDTGRGERSTATLDMSGPAMCQQMRAGLEPPNLRPVCLLEEEHAGPHQGTYRGTPVTWED